MNQKAIDEMYMMRCLCLASQGRQHSRPNPMVGAVLVADGRIIGEGYHVRYGEGHAEVNAFRSVRAEDECLLPAATLYVSLEPCSHYGKTPPCADLIVQKRVKRVVVGCVDSFSEVCGRGIERLRAAGIEVIVGVMEEECRWLNRRFFKFHEQGIPYIIIKYAQSDDGFIDHDGHAYAFSTQLTRMAVHRLRAEEDAIVVGRVTAEREQPALNVRYWAGRNPRRFVLSGSFGVEQLFSVCREESLQSLIVEGGGETLRRFIAADLWDEIRVETAPVQLGSGTKAPDLPANAVLMSCRKIDGNEISCYRRASEI